MTQQAVVKRLLEQRGAEGVTAHELIYNHGITRAAAIVFDLRHPQDGSPPMNILTRDDGPAYNGKRRTARYVLGLNQPSPRPAQPVAANSVAPLPPPAPLAFGCGCVRSDDGRSWASRCLKHGG